MDPKSSARARILLALTSYRVLAALGWPWLRDIPEGPPRSLATELVQVVQRIDAGEFGALLVEEPALSVDTSTVSPLVDQREWDGVKKDLLPLALAERLSEIPTVESAYIDMPDGFSVYVLLDSESSNIDVMRRLARIEVEIESLVEGTEQVRFDYVPVRYVDPASFVPNTATCAYKRATDGHIQ